MSHEAGEDAAAPVQGDAPPEPQLAKQGDVVEAPLGDSASPTISAKEKPDDPAEEEYISGLKLFAVLLSVTITSFIFLLDTSIVGTAVPRITTEFHSLPDVGWYGAAYLLANCGFTPLTGKIYTYFNAKWVFLCFTAVFELGSLVCGIAPNSDALIVGRAIAGLGASGLMNGGITIIANSVPLPRRPLFMGVMMSCAQIGVILGPLLGGLLTEHATWRWCFYINLPIGAVVVVIIIFTSIPDKRVKDPNRVWNLKTIFSLLDIAGFFLFAPCTVMFLLALEWGGTVYPWNSSTVIGLFCGSAAMFSIFLFWEYRRGDNAMIPFSIIKRMPVWSCCAVAFFLLSSMLIQAFYLPIYFQTIRNVTPTLSGVYLLPAIGPQIIFAVVSGALFSRISYVLPWSAASGILTTIAGALLGTLKPDTSTAMWVGFLILAGAGRGLGLQMPFIQMQNVLLSSQVAVGTSLMVFSQSFGGALFLSFSATAFTNGLKDAIPEFAPEVNPLIVIAAGASGVRSAVSAASLPGVLQAYNQALQHVFYISAGAAAGSLIFCMGMGWKKIEGEKKKAAPPEDGIEKEKEDQNSKVE